MQTLYHVKVEGSTATVETLAWGGDEVSSITAHVDTKKRTEVESRFGTVKAWFRDPQLAILAVLVPTYPHYNDDEAIAQNVARVQIADLLLVLLKMGKFGQGATVSLDDPTGSGQNVASGAPEAA